MICYLFISFLQGGRDSRDREVNNDTRSRNIKLLLQLSVTSSGPCVHVPYCNDLQLVAYRTALALSSADKRTPPCVCLCERNVTLDVREGDASPSAGVWMAWTPSLNNTVTAETPSNRSSLRVLKRFLWICFICESRAGRKRCSLMGDSASDKLLVLSTCAGFWGQSDG